MSSEKVFLLKRWRDNQAKKEGVEVYRVLSNQTIEEIVLKNIKTEKELLEVKGIKEKKILKYGKEILKIMNPSDFDRQEGTLQEIIGQRENSEKIFSVSVFLDLVNIGLRSFGVKIRGEVTNIDERGNVFYFNLKDKQDGSTISCLIWKNNYRLAGLDLLPGMEIVAHGFPNVYKPNGRISFQSDTLELVGEGVLKQQFEKLKIKLDKEGLFAQERKKTIPPFPHKIGLITSRQGEAIFDFRTNLGKFGFDIKFYDSRVEGVLAVSSLLKAVRHFRKTDIDVLVLVRGGGSLESLLSFNNEILVREIAKFPKPVITGVGHEQDVSLVDMVADYSCSTPTGVAKLLSNNWEQVLLKVNLYEKELFNKYQKNLDNQKHRLDGNAFSLRENFSDILNYFKKLEFDFRGKVTMISNMITLATNYLSQVREGLVSNLKSDLQIVSNQLKLSEMSIHFNDPKRQLRLGYSLVRFKGKLLKSTKSIGKGEEIKVELADGEITSLVSRINNGK